TTKQEHVLLRRGIQRSAVEAAPAGDQFETGGVREPPYHRGFQQPMNEVDAPVPNGAPLAPPDSPVMKGGSQDPAVEPVALRVFELAAGGGMAEARPRPASIARG